MKLDVCVSKLQSASADANLQKRCGFWTLPCDSACQPHPPQKKKYIYIYIFFQIKKSKWLTPLASCPLPFPSLSSGTWIPTLCISADYESKPKFDTSRLQSIGRRVKQCFPLYFFLLTPLFSRLEMRRRETDTSNCSVSHFRPLTSLS